MVNKINKKGQVSIFVIVGILLVGGILLFLFLSRSPSLNIRQEFSPQAYLDSCIRDSLHETVDLMLEQGGFVDPQDYKIYNDVKVAYLCKNINYYEPCITQYPRYITRLEIEIENKTREDVSSCFDALKNELERRNYEFEMSSGLEIDAKLKPQVVDLNVVKQFSFSKQGTVQDFDSFKTSINDPLYNIALVANEIAAQESRFCYFEYVGYMILYNQWSIKKFTMSDSTKIYSIKDKRSGKEMNIATRGCAVPAGF